jgi:hypothetical protein
MKTNFNEYRGDLMFLSDSEMSTINGGGDGFWYTAGYVIGVTLKSFYVFTKTAAEYQSSLPANLKK